MLHRHFRRIKEMSLPNAYRLAVSRNFKTDCLSLPYIKGRPVVSELIQIEIELSPTTSLNPSRKKINLFEPQKFDSIHWPWKIANSRVETLPNINDIYRYLA